jgi:hypothetical protein
MYRVGTDKWGQGGGTDRNGGQTQWGGNSLLFMGGPSLSTGACHWWVGGCCHLHELEGGDGGHSLRTVIQGWWWWAFSCGHIVVLYWNVILSVTGKRWHSDHIPYVISMR